MNARELHEWLSELLIATPCAADYEVVYYGDDAKHAIDLADTGTPGGEVWLETEDFAEAAALERLKEAT